MEPVDKEKYDYLNHLLSEGDAMVCLDARRPDVDVPKTHKSNPVLNLVFNLNFRRPFEIDESGIFATLSFGGRPHKCVIPFPAVWAIYEPATQKGQVWDESIPRDIDLEAQLKQGISKTTPGPHRPPVYRSPAEAPREEKTRRDRSHLRVIK